MLHCLLSPEKEQSPYDPVNAFFTTGSARINTEI